MNEPDGIVDLGSLILSEEDVAGVRVALEKRLARGWRPRLLTPLPRRVRLRLWAARQVDGIGSWLCGHRAGWAAVALWRALGMWP